ncbi:MAG: hypothetical protein HZB56_18940 [Deltaproteobacteria bacterium]|nr:hypothetical protein [Deltaproteobacteria bacterium]
MHLRQALAAARGRRRLDLVYEAPDPAALVRSLPAEELYFTIRDIGLADAAELVRFATPGQFRALIDLDAWRKDQLDVSRTLPWLRAARAGARGDDRLEAAWRRKLTALDMEVVELVLRDSLRIHDLAEDPDPEIEGDRFLRTTEGKFIVEFTVDGAEYLAVRGLLEDLYAEEPLRAARMLTALRWELPSELHETALRWRTGRLRDLGFPALEEALSWFARPARGPAPSMAGGPPRPSGSSLALRPAGSLLGTAAEGVSEERRQVLEVELVAAANATLVADGVDPSDLEAVRGAVEASRALVELGLAARAGGDPAGAVAALEAAPLKVLFQEGFGRLLQLRWRAEKVRAALAERSLGSPLDEALQALVRRRPRYFPGLEADRADWDTPVAAAFESRPFLSEADVARAEAALAEAESRAANPGPGPAPA